MNDTNSTNNMKKNLYIGGLIFAVIFFLIGVYYLIPGISHPFVSQPTTSVHLKHVVLFMGIAAISLAIAIVNRNKDK